MEEWKVIEKSNGKYEISNFGRCRNIKKGTILKENNSSTSARYNICGKMEFVKKLVATAFIENKYNCDKIRNIDGNINNNHADNLEWVVSYGKKVEMYDKNGTLLMTFSSCSIAGAFFKSNNTQISLCANGKKESAHGYYWKFV